jgi:hypothetical protein
LLEVHQRSGHSPIASTRYRDLFDLVVFAHTATIDAQSLAVALRSEAVRRSLALPDRLTKPLGSGWPAGYARVARETPQLAERDLVSCFRNSWDNWRAPATILARALHIGGDRNTAESGNRMRSRS